LHFKNLLSVISINLKLFESSNFKIKSFILKKIILKLTISYTI
jgi:hypothetical protein